MLPIGNFLKVGEIRSEGGVTKRWNGTAWIVNGTGTPDVSRWPTARIEEESVREDVLTGVTLVFRNGAWIVKAPETGGTPISEAELDAMENYVEVVLGEDYPVAGRPLHLHPDGKAYTIPSPLGGALSSFRVGISNQTGTTGQTVRTFPIGVVKGLTGIVPKRRYEVSYSAFQNVVNAITSISGGRSAVLGSEMYTIGMGGTTSNRVNLANGTVTSLTNWGGLYNHAVVACNGYVYVIGGTHYGMGHHVTRLDANGDAVTPLPSFYSIPLAFDPNVRVRAVAVGNVIYVISKDAMNGLCNIQSLDTTTDVWTMNVVGIEEDLYNSVPVYVDEGAVQKLVFLGGYDNMLFSHKTRQVEWTIGEPSVLQLIATLPFGISDGYAHKVGTEYVVFPTSGSMLKSFAWDEGAVTYWGNAGYRAISGMGIVFYDGFFYGYGVSDPMTMQNSIVAKITKNVSAIFSNDTYSMGAFAYMHGITPTSAYVLPI